MLLSEGAKRCLTYAFSDLNLKEVVSVCTIGNKTSEKVMLKIGMTKQAVFNHSKLKAYPEYEKCVWYKVENQL
ncbi:GNAT family N-acetyltransferase [Aquimarina agarivorans]|uniref:GNAT family N-acetyltransferase n=1 Tax=Aquimarina agarivorans TaxID=980584 RepID=UPI0002F8F711|nr:GNAT family N-acetyltransferase [Aquimarina agarivorans]